MEISSEWASWRRHLCNHHLTPDHYQQHNWYLSICYLHKLCAQKSTSGIRSAKLFFLLYDLYPVITSGDFRCGNFERMGELEETLLQPSSDSRPLSTTELVFVDILLTCYVHKNIQTGFDPKNCVFLFYDLYTVIISREFRCGDFLHVMCTKIYKRNSIRKIAFFSFTICIL